ncbi:3-oxoadipate enol-lactonase [Limimaricola hongkongensis]|uniref:Beta-ketoadipate enol-lactone hydrolase n=1 Tax=Limimaricola hongkongensis DSM 17492 TaxID=1122180 RepID=A0A017HCW5_9RHOB|nr:3-oxoadipate enol-lactonase [Limimaricola hongkongensis]EYD72221.1 Beta-ketoadipate enol-lactone hydrolase [Limimaricola hongkongensis DSM 17492]
MIVTARDGCRLATRIEGPEGAPALVLAHGLGMDMTLWDAVLPLLPGDVRVLRYDLRGHGGSDAPEAPYAMGQMISDAEAVIEAHGLRDTVFAGLSLGGMVAQGLAVKRLDLVRGLVLSNTAAKIGTPKLWDERIAAIRRAGIAAQADAVLDRWLGRDARHGPVAARARRVLTGTAIEGYVGASAAVSGTDFWTPVSGLRLPVLGLAGSEDRSVPADLMRETVELVPGARFEIIRRAGHLAPAERPEDWAAHVAQFLRATGHAGADQAAP